LTSDDLACSVSLLAQLLDFWCVFLPVLLLILVMCCSEGCGNSKLHVPWTSCWHSIWFQVWYMVPR
jgi:hypothetical protein